MSRTLAFYTLAIMNAAAVFGRTIPNLLADHFGKFNVFVSGSQLFLCTSLVCFGKSEGERCLHAPDVKLYRILKTIAPPVLTMPNIVQIKTPVIKRMGTSNDGYLSSRYHPNWVSDHPFCCSIVPSYNTPNYRIYIGVDFFFTSFANRTGTPISGALLGDGAQVTWSKPIIFSGITILAGTAAMMVFQQLVAHRRGTEIV